VYKSIEVRISLENSAFSRQNPELDIEAREVGYSIAAFIETVAIIGDSDVWCKRIIDSNGNCIGSMKLVFSEEEPTCSC